MKRKKLESKVCFCLVMLILLVCAKKDDMQKGVDAIKRGEYAKALKSLNAALKVDSLDPQIHYNISLAYAYLDSAEKCYVHYLKLAEMESNLKDDNQLREIVAQLLHMEPYPSSLVRMRRMNQFKGSFGPDGKTIVIAAAKRDRANIYLMQLDGKIIKKITKHRMNTDPDFSPTGEHIVFVSDIDGDDELYLYSLETKKTEKLSDNTCKDFFPSFSPDGKEIVYISNRDDPLKWEIYRINIANKKIKRLTNNKYWDGFPKFSSDGKSIVFSSKRNGSEDIYIMNKNGGGEKVFYSSEADDNDPTLYDNFLFFKSNIDGEWEIYRLNLKDKSILQLTSNKYPDWNPRISKDCSKILLARRKKKRWSLYYIDLMSPIPAEMIIKRIEEEIGREVEEKIS
jgi:TolB protein